MDTYYTLLGIEPDTSQADIAAAYQQRRESYSPDRVAGMDDEIRQLAEERMAELERAYYILSDTQRRRQYDVSIGFTSPREGESAAPRPHKNLSSRERWYAAGGMVGALLLVVLIWFVTDRAELPSIGEVNRPAPDFRLPALAGGEIQLHDYQGSVVLVNFWGTWCEPCKRETPALQSAYEQLRDQGLVVVGVNLTDDELVQGNSEADIRSFVEQYGVTYPIALDIEGEATKAFRVYPLPTSFFIDRQGNIRYMRVGELTTEEVVALFDQLHQEAAALEHK